MDNKAMENRITIKTIPAHFVYRAEYDQKSIMDFFDMETDENILYDLQELMESENPEVKVPDDGTDYNYWQLPLHENPDGTKHIIYRDMVDRMGQDSPSGAYVFEEVPEATVAELIHTGSYETVEKVYYRVIDWAEQNGYSVAGPGRCSAVNGPWDRDDPEEFVNEIQVPVIKEEI